MTASTRKTIDDPLVKKVKWKNRQRVLVFAARGISFRERHLMENIRELLPHSKSDNKKDKKSDLTIINEMVEMKNCNKCIYFENRKHKDLYMWISNVSSGPSAKFLVENIHTKDELKLTGNSLRGTRPLLCFDSSLGGESAPPHYHLLKELLTQIFGSPNGHPKTQPFFDRVFVFSLVDGRIWFRNYQIVEEDGQLSEIGPRFVLNPIKIFQGSFGGATLWSNNNFQTPANIRSMLKKASGMKARDKAVENMNRIARDEETVLKEADPTDKFFGVELPDHLKDKKKGLYENNPKKRRKRRKVE